MPRLPLIAVVGPVEPSLFRIFVEHYRRLGASDILVAFHFISEVPRHRRAAILNACRELIGHPVLISQGPWHEEIHGSLRDHLRFRAGTGWHILADVDEFHAYTEPPDRLIAAAEDAGSRQIGGLLLDRVAADGKLRAWKPEIGLDSSYPLGGFMTSRLLGGNPRKIVLAHSSLELILGSHKSRTDEPVNDPLVPVHHFKWRAGILDDLRRRVAEHTRGTWTEVSPAIRTEARAFLEHIQINGGRINIKDSRLMFQQVSLNDQPESWPANSRDVYKRYREFRKWSY